MEVKLLAYLLSFFGRKSIRRIFSKVADLKYHRYLPSASLTILYYTILYYTIPYYTILYYSILYYTILYYTVLYCTILYYTILYYTILYYTILYYTILYYTILYYTILYYTILYYTILHYTVGRRSYRSREKLITKSLKYTIEKLKETCRTLIAFNNSIGSRG